MSTSAALKDKENAMSDTQVVKEKLLHDFNEVVSDTEQLLKSFAATGGDKTSALRADVEESLKSARDRLVQLQREAVARTRHAARATDEYVHEHPWRSVAIVGGIAAIVGIIVGLLLNRR